MAEKKLKIMETVLRDAHQSLAATRMRTEDMLPILDKIDKVGYHSVECWGGATFDACLRFLNEDPWDRLRKLRKGMPNTKLQMLLRGQNLLGYRHYADDVVEYFVQRSIANGIDIIRIFDALNDLRNLETSVKAAKNEAFDSAEAEQISDNITAGTRKKNLAIIRERLSRVYEYEKMTKIPVKVSASALAEKESNVRYSVSAVPDFMRKGGLSGAEKGTAMHTFIQYCDFERARTSLEEEIENLVKRGFLTEVQGNAINRQSINDFLHSDLMNRMLSSSMLEREFRFTVEIPAGLADKTLEFPYSEEPIILQGAVDCLFEENGKIIIVDYKTDWGKSSEELTDMYSPQLRLYKLAIEQVLGKIVSQCVIYSFGLGREIAL